MEPISLMNHEYTWNWYMLGPKDKRTNQFPDNNTLYFVVTEPDGGLPAKQGTIREVTGGVPFMSRKLKYHAVVDLNFNLLRKEDRFDDIEEARMWVQTTYGLLRAEKEECLNNCKKIDTRSDLRKWYDNWTEWLESHQEK